MQRVAAYLLERAETFPSPDARRAEGERLRAVIEAWLRGKGATSVDGPGTYAAIDGSDARCHVSTAVSGERSSVAFELSEVTQEGRRFVTTVSVTVGHGRVFVFAAMEVGAVATLITRLEVDARCPKVVRDLLAQPARWTHGASLLRAASKMAGSEAGQALALEIQRRERTIPVVVLSRVQGRLALPRLDERLAHDLAGLANVHSVDEAASWALTGGLRKPLSTYAGALRIYWPRLALAEDPSRHPLWTAARLRAIDPNPRIAVDRIRRQVRTIIMRASAAGVVRPDEIDDIRGAAARSDYRALQAKAEALEALKAKASSLEEFRDIADSYAADNDRLRHQLASRDAELDRARAEVRQLTADKRTLLFKLDQVRTATDDRAGTEPLAPGRDEADQPPVPGEIRYYKKTHAAAAHDVLVPIGACGHNAWQNATRADKARKGLARLLGRHQNWKSLQRCGSCTGGGVWKVRW